MLFYALIYLCAAVISVPIAKRLGLGSVLGYLIAGVIIGPYALHLVGDQDKVMHFAEFGVVMMLFLIGLELEPSKLWQLRKPIIGLGGSQVLLTALLITSALFLTQNYNWQTNLALGLALALSSTAIVLQTLQEKGLLKTQTGQNIFSVLLFQDIAVIPMLALLPVLAIHGHSGHADSHATSLISNLAVHWQIVISLLSIVGIILGGKYISNPIFRFVAESRLKEIFTALSLLIVVAITVLMTSIGLSPALGAFLAGVVLAESEFKHEIELDIEPFKGLLLGLFFITVGAGINIPLIIESPLTIIVSVIALIIIKAAVLALLAYCFKFTKNQGGVFTVALAQGGEFAFVLLAMSQQLGIVESQLNNIVIVVVALSMFISPFLLILHERLFSDVSQAASDEPDPIDSKGEVIIAGYGRFGQVIGRLLTAQGYNLTILDHSPSQIDLLRRFGNKVYYGDAARADLLSAAGAEDAKLLVVAVDDTEKSVEIINIAKKRFPHLKIISRAIDRHHAYELTQLAIDGFRRETFDSAIQLGVKALTLLGNTKEAAERAGDIFTAHDEESIQLLADIWGDDHSYGKAVRQRMEDLKQVLISDQEHKEEMNTCHANEEAK